MNDPNNHLSKFTYHPTLSHFAITPTTFLSTHPDHDALVTGGLIFNRPSPTQPRPKILLLLRSPTDFMPLLWEIPGGSVDSTDQSILHGLVREVFEETGLKVERVERLAVRDEDERYQGRTFFSHIGTKYIKFEFVVEVEWNGEREGDERGLEVKLDPNEHVRFLWVGEEECRRGWIVVEGENGGKDERVELIFTTVEQQEVVLKGFEELRGASK